MSVRRAQHEIDSAEFADWLAFFELEPWGSGIEDLRTGAGLSMLATSIATGRKLQSHSGPSTSSRGLRIVPQHRSLSQSCLLIRRRRRHCCVRPCSEGNSVARAAMTMVNPGALTAGLRDLERAVSESTLRQAALAGARIFLAEEKVRVRVASGEGRDNLIIAYDDEVSLEGVIASYIVTWTKEAFYLRFVEYGTSKMAAKPFKRPGLRGERRARRRKPSTTC